jgi:S1 RNA binding domain protein
LFGGGSLSSGTGETLTATPDGAPAPAVGDNGGPGHSRRPSQVPQRGALVEASLPATSPAGDRVGSTNADPRTLVGRTAEGTVTGITHFGAFVNLDNGMSGLIHISEIAYEYVRDVRDHVKENERVQVKVLQVNPQNGKFDLSLKQTREAPAAALPKWRKGRRDRALQAGADPVFEEKLSKFLKSSEERLLDVKRNLEAKRGGRYR